MDEAAASSLLDEAISHPRETYARASAVLDRGLVDDTISSVVLRAKGMAARSATTISESIDVLRDAVAAAERAGRGDLGSLAMVTLAGSLYIAGRADEAMSVLDAAAARSDPRTAGQIHFQRATLLARDGRVDEALAVFDSLLPKFEAEHDDVFVASTYGNRGLAHLERGDTGASWDDLREARRRFEIVGADFKVATMDHNLGRVAGRRGDLVEALRRFADAERALERLGEDTAEVQTNRVEVLLEAGLFADAAAVATIAERAMERSGLELDRAELALANGLARLGLEEPAAAIEHAERASELFARQRRTAWADEASLVAIRARGDADIDVEAAAALGRSLGAAGRRLAALQAWSVVARHDPLLAADEARAVGIAPAAQPIEVRLVRAEIEAREQLALGDVARALRLTRAAVALAGRQRLAVDAADVRAGIGAHLGAIAQLGLSIRREGGRPWTLVRWVDATRGGSLGQPTRPFPADDEIERLVGRLRAVQVASRDAGPLEAAELLGERARLQRQLAAAQRTSTAGHRTSLPLPGDLAPLAGEGRIVQFHRLGDRVGLVEFGRGQIDVVDVGPLGRIDAAANSLRFALLRLIAGRGDAAGVRQRAAQLDGLLLGALRRHEPACDTVIVPLPQHQRLPWSLFESLGGAAVAVAPSLRHLADRRRRRASPANVAVVEGPRLHTSTDELRRIVAVWSSHPTASVTAPVDRVVEALTALESADLVHVAAHGVRRDGDGRFAQLVLADGDVTAFDLERLRSAPPLVVLSACEAGVVDALPGEQSIGLSTALFDRGCETVIAGTMPLPDSGATAELFGRLHEHLAAGSSPARALRDAQVELGETPAGVVARSVSCFGRG